MTRRLSILAVLAALSAGFSANGGELIVDLGRSRGVTFVGALKRWDADGQPLRPVDPKATIDAPSVEARARPMDAGRWRFTNLPEGRYDLVVLARGTVRVEGFRYPPVQEFDPFWPPDAEAPDAEARDAVLALIKGARHYENKVEPLFLASGDTSVRVLMQLVRDQPTSYDAEYGKPIATIRHEVWQFDNRFGGWAKNRRTVVLDRVLLPRADLERWTWIWEPKLGGVVVGAKATTVAFELPERFEAATSRGWVARP